MGGWLGENATGALTTFTWDGENRLVSRADPTNGILTNTYDATGIRSKLVTPSATTIFVRDGQNILIEANASGVTQAHYTNNPGKWPGQTSQRISSVSAFHGFDLSSNGRILTGSTGSSVATYLTDAFGLEKQITGSTVDPFVFSGQVGLCRDLPNWMYAMARYLDTVRGGWPSRDPSGFRGGDWNLHRYAKNNPLRWVDPSGLSPTPPYKCPSCVELYFSSSCNNPAQLLDKIWNSSWQHYCDHPATHCYTCCILTKTVSAYCVTLAQACQDCVSNKGTKTTVARTTYCETGIANAAKGGTCSEQCTSSYPMGHGHPPIHYTTKDCCSIDCNKPPDDKLPDHADCQWHYCCGSSSGGSGSIFS